MWLGWLGVVVGAFAVGAGLFDWDWYWELPRARFWVDLLGRGGARVFLVLVGAVAFAAGVLLLSGI